MKSLAAHISILILTIGNALAQVACFTSDVTSGCAPLTVTITNCSASTDIYYEYEYDPANPFTQVTQNTTYTYSNPGTYTLIQYSGNSGGTVNTMTQTIEVLPSPAPVFSLQNCSDNIVNVIINDATYDQYRIDYGDGSLADTIAPPVNVSHPYGTSTPKTITVTGQYLPTYCDASASQTIDPLATVIKPDITKLEVTDQSTSGSVTLTFNAVSDQRYIIERSDGNNTSYATVETLSSLSGIQNLVYNNLNTASTQYCYRIAAIDDCNPPIYSEEICTIINSPSAMNNQNVISWNNHYAGNVSNYTISRNGSVIATQPTNAPYTDTDVRCGANYCYQITATLSVGNNPVSVSDAQCVTAISTNIPPAPQNLNSTISNNVPQLSWDKPSGSKEYEIFRSVDGAFFTSYTTTINTTYTDNNVSIPSSTYCYQLDLMDSCNNNSPLSLVTCPIILNVTVDPSNSLQNNLSWTGYIGDWPTGIQEYRVERLDENNNAITSFPMGFGFNYSDIIPDNIQIVKYRIVAIANGTGQVSYSNIVEINYEGLVFLPNAFTPDNDGRNDLFIAKGMFIKEYELTIYNRWGEVVFFTDQFNEGWNGLYNGTPATPDAYAYLVNATDIWGKSITKRGSVTLLR